MVQPIYFRSGRVGYVDKLTRKVVWWTLRFRRPSLRQDGIPGIRVHKLSRPACWNTHTVLRFHFCRNWFFVNRSQLSPDTFYLLNIIQRRVNCQWLKEDLFRSETWHEIVFGKSRCSFKYFNLKVELHELRLQNVTTQEDWKRKCNHSKRVEQEYRITEE